MIPDPRPPKRTPPSDRARLIGWLHDVALLCTDEHLAGKARREYVALTGREPRLPGLDRADR